MTATRRQFLLGSAALVSAGVAPAYAQSIDPDPPYRRIAAEEAWLPADILSAYQDLLADGAQDEPGFRAMGQFIYGRGNDSPLIRSLTDIGDYRLRRMDELGIHRQVLMLTAPGVQVFDRETAVGLARDSNDQLAEAIAAHPDRLSGLAAVAPQDPAAAAIEIERAIETLDLNGVIINSHTRGEYLDDPKFWEIFEAAEAHGAAIYLHPRTPAPAMLSPYLDRGLDQAIMGFGAEVALHTLALVTAGVFDRFPDLNVVIGHAGEGLPYWLYRIDYMQKNVRERSPDVIRLERAPSEYFRSNIHITSSGVAWEPAILFAQQVLGASQVMYAMDYPYQATREEVAASDHFDMAPADKQAFFEKNATRVFKL
jgi:2,3-dihydroxybenzoate decarboxylase